MSKTLHPVRLFVVFLLGSLFVFSFLVHYVGPRLIVKTSAKIFKAYRYTERGDITKLTYEYDSLTIRTKDGLLLKACLIHTDKEQQKGTIIFLHGIRAEKEIFVSGAEEMASKGYNSVLIDLRAHGESQGVYCTFGYYEKYDVSSLIDSLDLRINLSQNYGVWGQSLGGAVALQTLEIDPRLKFGIVESTFSSFETIVYDYISYNLKIKSKRLTRYLVSRSEKLGDFNSNEVVPVNSASRIDQPVLVVHGSVDNRINKKYGYEIFENLKSSSKEFVLVDSAKHSNVWEVGGEPYFKEVMSFLEFN